MLFIKYNLGEHTRLVHMQTNEHVVTIYLHLYRGYHGDQPVVLDILVPFRSVPLNIIICVDNYILRNGTEQS